MAGLDRFHLLILDDLAYFTKDQAETSVLFEHIASYERRSMLVTANQPFGEWGKVAMTLAAHEPRAKQNLTRGQVVKRLHRTFAVFFRLTEEAV